MRKETAQEWRITMKEKIYNVPVNDAFLADTECPVCAMFEQLENDAIEYTMGPSYMEDDIRAVTDKKGFCQKHIKKIYEQNNRLGYALVMKHIWIMSLKILKLLIRIKVLEEVF